MKNQMIVIGATLTLLIIGLSGCTEENNGNSSNYNFVGTWSYTGGLAYNDVIKLYSDGVASFTHHGTTQDYVHSGTWEVNGSMLIFHKDEIGDEVYTYRFTDSNTLILTMQGEDDIYKRL